MRSERRERKSDRRGGERRRGEEKRRDRRRDSLAIRSSGELKMKME